MYHHFFIYSSVYGQLGCFHILDIVNSATVNIATNVSFSIMVSLGYWPVVGQSDHMVVLKEFPYCSPQLHQFTFPAIVQESSLFSTYFSAFIVCRFFGEKTKIEKDTCIPLFIAALFTIARTWKQPRCPLTDEWIKKLWYIYTMENYSAIKRNTFESVLMRWLNLEPIIQSEVSQKEKDKYRILTYIYRIQKNGTEEFIYRAKMEKQTQRLDLWTWGEGRRG